MAADLSPPVGSLRGDPARQRRERLVRGGFLAAALLGILISAAIVASLIGNALSFLREVDPGALWSSGWFPRRGRFDVKTPIVGSVLVSLIAMAVAVPIGVGSAIFLSEYASSRVRRTVKPVLEILAGIPSVVLGYFALTVISPGLVQRMFSEAPLFNFLSAGIGVGILVAPLMASVTEDALRAVPRELREASYGLGARKRTTVVKVVLPAAVSGIVAAAVLSISRAIGETMVVTMAAGGSSGALFTADPLDGGIVLTSAIASLATGTDNVAGVGNAVDSLYFIGIVLFAFTLGLNVLGGRIVRRYRRSL